jgi:hypothetical protein
MKNKKKENALPSLGTEFELNGCLWQVTYLNFGNMRFSAEYKGKIPEEGGSVTLNIQSGTFTPKSKL